VAVTARADPPVVRPGGGRLVGRPDRGANHEARRHDPAGSATGRSSGPRCTPRGADASATSGRSLTRHGMRAPPQQPAAAAASSRGETA
jgi:hypothetical protein